MVKPLYEASHLRQKAEVRLAAGCKLPHPTGPEGLPYRVALEGLDRSVLTQLAHMDAHVCAAGGKRIVALPVHV